MSIHFSSPAQWYHSQYCLCCVVLKGNVTMFFLPAMIFYYCVITRCCDLLPHCFSSCEGSSYKDSSSYWRFCMEGSLERPGNFALQIGCLSFCFWLVTCLYLFWIINPYQTYDFSNIFSQSLGFIFAFLIVYFESPYVLTLMKFNLSCLFHCLYFLFYHRNHCLIWEPKDFSYIPFCGFDSLCSHI
jgi:hypothetical protein